MKKVSSESPNKTPQGTPSWTDYVNTGKEGDHAEAEPSVITNPPASSVLPPSVTTPVSETRAKATAANAKAAADAAAAAEERWPCYAPGDLNPQLVGKMGIMNDPSYEDNGGSMGRVGEGIRKAIRPNSLSLIEANSAIHGVVMGSYVLEAAAARSMNFSIKNSTSVDNQRIQILFVRVPEMHTNIPDPFCGDKIDVLCRTKKALIQLHAQIALPNELMASHALLPGSIVEIEFTNGHSKGLVKKIVSASSSNLTLGHFASASGRSVYNSGGYKFAEVLAQPMHTPEEIKECAANYDNPPSPYLPDWNKQVSSQTREFVDMHAEFTPYAKCFIWRCFVELGIQIRANRTYTTFARQAELYEKYLEKKRAGKKTLPSAKPGYSWHNYGVALDFNPILPDGRMLTSYNATKDEWIASGIPAIINSMNLKWGGDWGDYYGHKQYDPIHLDFRLIIGEKTPALKKRSEAEGVAGNRVSLNLS